MICARESKQQNENLLRESNDFLHGFVFGSNIQSPEAENETEKLITKVLIIYERTAPGEYI